MDVTPARGYPFPECDPPLTKDASDIAQIQGLAAAIDSDVQSVYNRAADVVVRPDAARMSMTAAVADTAGPTTLFPFFNARSFDTTGTNAMTPVTEGIMRLPEPGWYSIGAYAELVSTTYLGVRMAFFRNGIQAASYSTQAESVAGGSQIAHHTADLFVPTGGDTLTIGVVIGASGASYTYSCRLWAVQVAQL